MKGILTDRNLIISLIAIQLLICLPFVSSYSIDLDEPFSIFYAQQELSEFIPFMTDGNNPPLYFILLHYWMEIFGSDPFAVRAMSLLFSLLSIVFLFKFGKKMGGYQLALVVCGLFIFSTYNHYYAIEARMYSLVVMLCIMSIYFLHRILLESKVNSWILFAVVNALLFYTHYLAPFIIGVELLVVLVFFKELNKRKVISLLMSLLVFIMLISPLLKVFLERAGEFKSAGSWLGKPDWTEVYGNIIKFNNFTLAFFIFFGLIAVFAIYNRVNIKSKLKSELTNSNFVFVSLFFVLSYFGMYVMSLTVQPVFLDRYLVFTTPFLFLISAYLVKLVLTDMKPILAAFFVLPMIASCYYIPHSDRDGDALATYVEENKTSSTSILICPSYYDLTLMYHLDIEVFKEYSDYDESLRLGYIYKVNSRNQLSEFSLKERVIFVDAHAEFVFPNNGIFAGISETHNFEGKSQFEGGYVVYIFDVK